MLSRPLAVPSAATLRALACAAAACLALPQVAAQELYRWTDQQGKTHLSDRPPLPGQARSVSREAPPRDDRTPAQQREATDRATKDKARAAQLEAARRPAAKASQPASAAGPASAARPPAATAGGSCEAKWAEFRRSQDCFAPFRTANGGLKPGAMERCGAGAPDPGAECPLR